MTTLEVIKVRNINAVLKQRCARQKELLIEIERRVREHDFAHRRKCPYCGCQIGVFYPAIGVEPIIKHHVDDCELAKELSNDGN